MKKKTKLISKGDIIKMIKGFELEDPQTVESFCKHDKEKCNILWKSLTSKTNLKMEKICLVCEASLGFINPLGVRKVYYKKEDDFFKWLFKVKRTEEPYWNQKEYIVKYL